MRDPEPYAHGDGGGHQIEADGLPAESPELAHVTEAGHADQEGREDQGHDHHLDEAHERRADGANEGDDLVAEAADRFGDRGEASRGERDVLDLEPHRHPRERPGIAQLLPKSPVAVVQADLLGEAEPDLRPHRHRVGVPVFVF